MVEHERCPEYAQLQAAVLAILEKITGITTAQLHAFQERDHMRFTALDKALELAVG